MNEIFWKRWIGLLPTLFILTLVFAINGPTKASFSMTDGDLVSVRSAVTDNPLIAEYECKDEDGDEKCDDDPED